MEGVSQFSVEGDRDNKLKCKSITLVNIVNMYIVKGTQCGCGIFRIYVLVGLVEPTLYVRFLYQLGLYILLVVLASFL